MFMRLLTILILSLSLHAASVAPVEAQFSTPTAFTPRFQAVLTNSSGTTLVEIQPAPVGASLYITDVVMSSNIVSTTTADQQLNLKYGTGTNCVTGTTVILSYFNAATSGVVLNLQTPIKLPAGNALCFMDAVVGSKSVVVGGFIAP